MSPHEEAVRDLIEVIGTRKNMDAAIEAMIRTHVNNPIFRDHEPVVRAWAQKHLSFDASLPELVAIYARLISEEDARATAAFYRSEVGQRMTRVLPEMVARLSALGAERALAHQGDFILMLNDAKRSSQQKGKSS